MERRRTVSFEMTEGETKHLQEFGVPGFNRRIDGFKAS